MQRSLRCSLVLYLHFKCDVSILCLPIVYNSTYKNSHNAVEALIKFAPSVVIHRPVEARPQASGNTSTGQWTTTESANLINRSCGLTIFVAHFNLYS